MYQFAFVIYFRFKILIMPEVHFFYKEVRPSLKSRKALQSFLCAIFKREKEN
jgi:hypothetical protein